MIPAHSFPFLPVAQDFILLGRFPTCLLAAEGQGLDRPIENPPAG